MYFNVRVSLYLKSASQKYRCGELMQVLLLLSGWLLRDGTHGHEEVFIRGCCLGKHSKNIYIFLKMLLCGTQIQQGFVSVLTLIVPSSALSPCATSFETIASGDHGRSLARGHPQRPPHPVDHEAGHEAPRVPRAHLRRPPAPWPPQEGPPRQQPHRFLPSRGVEAPQHPLPQAVPLMWRPSLTEGAASSLLRADMLQVVKVLSLCSVNPGAMVGPGFGDSARDWFGSAVRCRGSGGGAVTCPFAFGCALLCRNPFLGL